VKTVGRWHPVASLNRVDGAPDPGWEGRGHAHSRVRVLLIAGLVLASLAAILSYQRSSARATHSWDGGPVRTDSSTATSLVADIGQVVTFGGIVLENFSRSPAVLESVRIDPHLDPAMTLVDVKVAGKDRGIGMVGTDKVFPPSGMPSDSLHPVAGAIVPPRQEGDEWGVEVLMAFKLNRPGQFGFRHAVVDYRIGGKRHRVRLDDAFVLCGPDHEYQSCDLDKFSEPAD
jgi:hypothetical protein